MVTRGRQKRLLKVQKTDPVKKAEDNMLFFGLNVLFKTTDRQNVTWTVVILMSYTEYLAWVAHASEVLVAKPAS